MDPDITGKLLQLLKEAAPKTSRVAVLYNPTFPATVLSLREVQAAAPALGLAILPMEVRAADELDAQLAVMTRMHAEALLTFGEPFTSRHQSRILDFAATHQWPAVSLWRELGKRAGSCPMGPACGTFSAALPPTCTRFCTAPSLGTCPWSRP